MKLLTKEKQGSYANAKICYISKEKLENKYLEDKKYRKVREIIDIIQGSIEVLCIAYEMQNIVCLKRFYSFS